MQYNMTPHLGKDYDFRIKRDAITHEQSTFCAFMEKTSGALGAFFSFRTEVEGTLRVLYIYELHVHHLAQGKGIGSALLSLAKQMARDQKLDGLMLTVQLSNGKAIKFYLREGLERSPFSPQKCTASQPLLLYFAVYV